MHFAVARAMSEFLVMEDDDFHEYADGQTLTDDAYNGGDETPDEDNDGTRDPQSAA